MKIAERLLVFGLGFILLLDAFGHAGCAMILPPSGGPRDSIPPVLVSAVPHEMTVNFKANKIVFTFDEYVHLDKLQENLIVSPVPRISPMVDFKLKTVTVKLKDTLKDNTTYEIDFGNAVQDVNENNVLRNFTYVFSTAPYIDSLSYSGRVLLAKTGAADSTLKVILHKKLDDSAVVNDRPRYVTTVDTAGYFRFHYLEAGTYAIYALKDESGTRKYLSKSQLFAFADQPITVGNNSQPVTLYAYQEEAESRKNKPSGVAVPKPSSKEKEKVKRLVLKTNLGNEGRLDVLGNLVLSFGTSLKRFDSTKLHFTDEQFKPISNYRLITDKDTTHKTIELVYNWDLDTKYHLIAEKDFAEDSAGQMLLKADTINIQTRREADYGELTITIKNLDLSRHPVLEFIQGGDIKFSFPMVGRILKRKLFPPGEYKLSILYDDNQNGVWDPGEFFGAHRQPEKVQQIPLNNRRKVMTVKTSWDNDVDIVL
ncbi:MAG TPA: Ig-like domain-containing protein [Puia sp.]|nr:Ig-like domain-containing protein [Puia sp.]